MTSSCLASYDGGTIWCWESCFAPTAVDISEVSLNTGDLLLAAANPSGRVPGLNAISACRWDHVGIIVMKDGVPYVVDSGGTRYYHFCTRPLHFAATPPPEAWAKLDSGPQMYPLAKFIEQQGVSPLEGGSPPWFYERLAVRSLVRPLSDAQIEKMEAAIDQHADVLYQQAGDNAGEMTKAAVDVCWDLCGTMKNSTEHRNSLFCSELTALAYIEAGLLPPSSSKPANEYVPADFAREHGNNLAAFCCCCPVSWGLGRCGFGELRDAAGGISFGPERVLRSVAPPAEAMARGTGSASARVTPSSDMHGIEA